MFEKISELLKGKEAVGVATASDIKLYTTRFCPYCVRAKMLLDKKGWSYCEIAVDGDYEKRAEMMQKSGRHTVPQIWIGDLHVGGCDDLFRLELAGELDRLVMGAGQ